MAADIQRIAQLLDATLDPQQHRKGKQLLPAPFAVQKLTMSTSTAENALKQEEKQPQYSLSLLKIVAEQTLNANTRLAAALAFKNFVRLNYIVRSPHPWSCKPQDISNKRSLG